MGEVVVTMDFLVPKETPYDILIGLPTMITIRKSRLLLQQDKYKTFKDGFISNSVDEAQQEVEGSIEELVWVLTKPEMKTERSFEAHLMDKKLSHLSTKDAEVFEKIIRDYFEVIAN